MEQEKKVFFLIKKLFTYFSALRKKQFSFILALMFFASFAEVLSLGAIFPFLAVLAEPELIRNNDFFKVFIDFSKFNSDRDLIFFFTLAFVMSALLSGFLRVLLLITSIRVSFAAGADISNKIFFKTLFQPYKVHISRNSSEVINGVFNKTSMIITGVLMPIFMLLSATVFIVFMLLAMFFVNPLLAGVVAIILGGIYVAIASLSRKALNFNGQKVSFESTKMIQYLQEAIGGIRNILIDNTQEYYLKFYKISDASLRYSQGTNQIFTLSPRYVMEALGIVVIALSAYYLGRIDDDFSSLLPVLGTLALGAQRLLPIFQQAYSNWGSIQAYKSPLDDVLMLLEQDVVLSKENINCLPFEKEINLKQIKFSYHQDNNYVLNEINLTIKKGEKIGIIGPTGSGKSTFMDILMGLLEPTHGELKIDKEKIDNSNLKEWQKNISHVPQSIFLSDSSILENIAFGIDKQKIDIERVSEAAKKAQISDFIENLPKKYNTRIGENGIQLSGGQRQRIGISRAFYKDANVLFLDEATSALDNETEVSVMDSFNLFDEKITLIMIAHRMTTLKKCDRLILIKNGKIVKEGFYEDFNEK